MLIREDLTGRVSGMIRITAFNPIRSKKNSHWNYVCECGNVGVIAAGDFKRNRSTFPKSCGCVNKKQLSLVGHKYGKLTPISISEKKGYKYYWLCLCDCGREKSIPESSLRKPDGRGTRTCGMCRLEGDDYIQAKMDILMKHIKKDPSGCWLWTGSLDKNGYGIFPSKRFDQRAPRAAYKLLVGEITDGLWVLHKCDVKGCVNPEHLYLGDVRQNVKDAMERGRLDTSPNPAKGKKGELNTKSKLKEEDVVKIRSIKNPNGQMNRWLARCYRIHINTIRAVIKRKTWQHI